MGRPREFDREYAIKLAMDEYWLNGYSNVSVKALCEKLAITRSSFYNTFGSLEKLYEEVLEYYVIHGPAPFITSRASGLTKTATSDQPGDPLKQLMLVFRQMCQLRAKDKENRGCLLVNSLSELSKLSDKNQETLLAKLHQTQASFFKACVEAAIENGQLPQDTNKTNLLMALQTLAAGLNSMSKVIHSEKKLWGICETTLSGLGIKVKD